MDKEKTDDVAKLFGANLKRLREKKDWLQTDLADQLRKGGLPKYSQVAVSRTEEGNRTVRLDEALIIAKVLGVTIEQLLEPSDTFMRRFEALLQERNAVYALRKELIGVAREYEKRREETKEVVREIRESESKLSLTDEQKELFRKEMKATDYAARFNAVSAVRAHVLNNDGDLHGLREERAAKASAADKAKVESDGNDS